MQLSLLGSNFLKKFNKWGVGAVIRQVGGGGSTEISKINKWQGGACLALESSSNDDPDFFSYHYHYLLSLSLSLIYFSVLLI